MALSFKVDFLFFFLIICFVIFFLFNCFFIDIYIFILRDSHLDTKCKLGTTPSKPPLQIPKPNEVQPVTDFGGKIV